MGLGNVLPTTEFVGDVPTIMRPQELSADSPKVSHVRQLAGIVSLRAVWLDHAVERLHIGVANFARDA